MMKPKFYKDEDGDEQGWYGRLYYHHEDGRVAEIMHIPIQTPYFEHKLDCEKYTRILAEANDLEYDYTGNIWFHHGYWRR